MGLKLGPRRAITLNIADEMKPELKEPLAENAILLEEFDLLQRSLCAMMYNYVPTSGHPGGSISSGRFVAPLLFYGMDYDISNPHCPEADLISYAAGHKALGLYSLWALRNEMIRIAAPHLLARELKNQFRLEDLLGFRRNRITSTPLFKKFRSKALDGHPTPATPFVKLATGASGVGVASSVGLAFGLKDYYGQHAPRVHVIEGEGGMTPGRVAEAFAAAATASLSNLIIHIDWNQASIDSNHVCRENEKPGDYVQWNPVEFALFHDWNALYVPDGTNLSQILLAQKKALSLNNGQPTAIIYRTVKGWHYGIEGKASHGAGHKLCSEGYFKALEPFMKETSKTLPRCEPHCQRCEGGKEDAVMEACFWEALSLLRRLAEDKKALSFALAESLKESKRRLASRTLASRSQAPQVSAVLKTAAEGLRKTPPELHLAIGSSVTLRGALGSALRYYNKVSHGALLSGAADLLGSTSINEASKDFPEGFFKTDTHPESRTLSLGGICEDAMSGVLAGVSTVGHHIGVGSSYGAFLAPLGHIAARLHCIGSQARQETFGIPCNPLILICAHAGLKTGEDGPTHADPQALQIFQENFPRGLSITLTPWDPQEIWPLLATALHKKPAVIAPFVTRPSEKILDRKALGLEPVAATVNGVYQLIKVKGKADGTIILQESGVTYTFIEETLPLLKKKGIRLNVYYVSSAELFDLLPVARQKKILPESVMQSAMGITGFTFSTMYRWIRSDFGRSMTLHPFMKGHYLGSGQASKVLAEAGLDGAGQFKGIMKYLRG